MSILHAHPRDTFAGNLAHYANEEAYRHRFPLIAHLELVLLEPYLPFALSLRLDVICGRRRGLTFMRSYSDDTINEFTMMTSRGRMMAPYTLVAHTLEEHRAYHYSDLWC